MHPGPDAGVLRRYGPVAAVVLALAALVVAGWRFVVDTDDASSPSKGLQMFPDALALTGVSAGPRPVAAGRALTVDVAAAEAVEGDVVLLNLVVSGAERPGEIAAFPCESEATGAARSGFEAASSSFQVLSAVGPDGRVCLEATEDVSIAVEAIGRLPAHLYAPVQPAVRLLDTRTASSTADDARSDAGPVSAGTTVEVAVVDLDGAGVPLPGMVAVTVETLGRDVSGTVTVRACDATTGPVVEVRPTTSIVRSLVVPVGTSGTLCLAASAPSDLVVALNGVIDASLGRPFVDPVRIVDTRAAGATIDARFAGIGVRPESSTLEVPVTDRIGTHDGLVALVLNIAADQPLDDGQLTVFAAGSQFDRLATLQYRAGASHSTTAVVPVRASGEICVTTTGRTDLVIDVVGLLTSTASGSTASEPSDAPAARGCPQQQLFPERRLVALYGSNRTPRLGALGEQDVTAVAGRLEEIVEPWREGERPVLPAFELIATLATTDDGDDGLHRLRSPREVVQGYLDVARRHGYYLILDIQPGWSDFLTEAMYYESFLRQPDVGLALDPEWRTRPPNPPAGGYVGQTDAAEINAVAEWLARIVAEEDLPEKLLVVHQFQERMVLDRDQLIEPPGIALTFHMDGFGSRGQKQHTWSQLRVSPPWNNGLKLFFDEDIDRYRADEILAGAFDPVPDLITYQ